MKKRIISDGCVIVEGTPEEIKNYQADQSLKVYADILAEKDRREAARAVRKSIEDQAVEEARNEAP